MRVLIVGIIVLSLGVAGVATYLITTFKTPEAIDKLQEEKAPLKIKVLVANQDLPIGAVLTEQEMSWQAWVEEALNEQFTAVEDEEQQAERMREFAGGIVRRVIHAGEPILASKLFKRDEPGFLAGMLEPGMRAMSISVSAVTSASGFIFPGDYVDVVLTHGKIQEVIKKRVKKNQREKAPLTILSTASETILRHVRILATGQKVDQFDKKAMVVGTVTLELTPKQAEMIITAKTMGKMSLVLRSLEEGEIEEGPLTYTTDVEVSPFLKNFDSNIQELMPPPRAPASRVATKKTEKTEKKEKKRVISVFRGGASKTEEVSAK